MPPTLLAIAGPLAGAAIPIDDEDVHVGRDAANRLTLADAAVSPRHCVFSSKGGTVFIRDLDPDNPSFVNGLPAGERVLVDEDRVQIGNSVFVLRLAADAETPAVQVDEQTDLGPSLIVMRREDVFEGHPGEYDDPARAMRDLAALLKIGATLSAVHGLVALRRPLLELVGEAIPTDRAALVLNGTSDAAAGAAAGWERGGSTGPVHVSRSVVDRVLRDVVGVLDEDDARSILGAPLVAFDKVLGAIVLEKARRDGPFDAGHLRLLMGIAASAGMAFEYARQVEWLEGENRRLQATLDSGHNMVGDSARIREVYKRIARVAPTDSTVLITGESGTGKELVAHAIHRNSTRTERPFVAINCAAITETLLETELFGHEKGAFTGAIAQKKGKLETAEGGTVFLDEIGELSASLQAKLLRVLQEREFERVGGTRSIRVNFRLIAATNRNLEQAIEGGAFRSDLYYRINVVALAMPALRDRRDDIPLLASYFLRRHGDKAKRRVAGFAADALACLTSYDWPGNVRELENAIERALVLGSTPMIMADDLPDAVLEAPPVSTAATRSAGGATARFHDAVKEAKKALILRALEQARGNHNAAAKLLGLHPNYLHRLVTNLQLRTAVKNATDR